MARPRGRAYLSAPMPAALDILAVLRLALRVWWREFAPIIGLGALLVLAPQLTSNLLHPTPARGGTIMLTVQGACLMLFQCAVAYGVLCGLARRPLTPGAFMHRGLAAAEPGIKVALLLGMGAITVGIAFAVAPWLGPVAGGALRIGASFAGVWGLVTLLPAVPAAVVERLGPIQALARAAQLTRGNRLRLVGLCALVVLALIPVAGTVAMIVYGRDTDPAEMARLAAALTPASPALWINLLTSLLLAGILACVPTAVYAMLLSAHRSAR